MGISGSLLATIVTLGFRVSGFRVSGFRVFKFRVYRIRVSGLGFRVYRFQGFLRG